MPHPTPPDPPSLLHAFATRARPPLGVLSLPDARATRVVRNALYSCSQSEPRPRSEKGAHTPLALKGKAATTTVRHRCLSQLHLCDACKGRGTQ